MIRSIFTTATTTAFVLIASCIYAQGLSDALRLRVTNDSTGAYDETVIRFHANASRGWDGNYDAHKLFSSNSSVPSLFTRSESGWDLSINAYPELEQDYELTVYMLSTQGGSFSLSYEMLGAFEGSTFIAVKEGSSETYHSLSQLPLSFSVAGSSDTLEAFRISFSIPPVVTVLTRPCPESSSGTIALTDVGNPDFNYELINADGLTVRQVENVSGSAIIEGVEPGAYELRTSSPTGEATVNEVTMEATPVVVLNTVIQNSSCDIAADGAIELEVTEGDGPFAVSWSHSASNDWILNNLTAGEYRVTVADTHGCLFESAHEVLAEDPELAILESTSGSDTFEVGESVVLMNTAADAEQSLWDVNGENLEGSIIDVSLDQAGVIEVELTGILGECKAVQRLSLAVQEQETEDQDPLGTAALSAQDGFGVYYHAGILTIESGLSPAHIQAELQVYDALGKNVFSQNVALNGQQRIPLSVSSAGVYVVQLAFDGRVSNHKLIIP